MISLFIFLGACTTFPLVDHVQYLGEPPMVVDGAVAYKCDSGYRTEDKKKYGTIVCQADGSFQTPVCKGEYRSFDIDACYHMLHATTNSKGCSACFLKHRKKVKKKSTKKGIAS